MAEFARSAFGLAVAAVLHISLRQFAPWLAALVDPLLIWVTVHAMEGRVTRGMAAGMVAGWSEDALVGETLMGLNGAAGLCAGFVVALAARQLVAGSSTVLGLLFVLAVATQELVLLGLQLLLTADAGVLDPVSLLLRCAVNSVAGLLVLQMIARFAGWSRRVQRSRFNRVRLDR